MAKKNIPYDQKYYDPEIECMPRPELEKLQLERLKEMVRFAYENAPYYKRSFDEAGVSPDDLQTLADIQKFHPSSTRRPNATPRAWALSSASCARSPKRRSSSWPPPLAPPACRP